MDVLNALDIRDVIIFMIAFGFFGLLNALGEVLSDISDNEDDF